MKYRDEVGPAEMYDIISAQQFCVMVKLGLREESTLLDFGCGSLRGGRLFIPYLGSGNYYGVEPDEKLLDDGIDNEIGREILKIKKPSFYHFDNFEISRIGKRFGFILAQSILSHAGPDVLEKILEEASMSLVENGTFAATFFEGPNSKVQGWLGHGIATYKYDLLKELAGKHGLACKRISIKHPAGQKWVRFLA